MPAEPRTHRVRRAALTASCTRALAPVAGGLLSIRRPHDAASIRIAQQAMTAPRLGTPVSVVSSSPSIHASRCLRAAATYVLASTDWRRQLKAPYLWAPSSMASACAIAAVPGFRLRSGFCAPWLVFGFGPSTSAACSLTGSCPRGRCARPRPRPRPRPAPTLRASSRGRRRSARGRLRRTLRRARGNTHRRTTPRPRTCA